MQISGRSFKNVAATAEKQYFDNVYYVHKKSCIFSPGAQKNQNYSKRLHKHHILSDSPIEMMIV